MDKRTIIERFEELAEANENAFADWLESHGYRSIHNEQRAEIDRLTRERDEAREDRDHYDMQRSVMAKERNTAIRQRDTLKEALMLWQKWWELPCEARRFDIASARYITANIALASIDKEPQQ